MTRRLLAELGARLFEQAFGAVNTPEDMRDYLAAAFSVDMQTTSWRIRSARR